MATVFDISEESRSTFPGKRKRHKSENSKNESGQPLKKAKQRRETRQTFLDSESTVSSLDFHPTTHTFAASCFDGKINLYHIDANKKTTLSHSLHHPLHKKTANTQSLQQLIESNEAKMQRLKELQLKNNQQFTFDFNEDEEEEDEDDCDDHKIDSISMESSSTNYKPHHAVPCKESLFNGDGSLIFGAWNDSEIGIFDHSKESLIHHFNNNAFDTETCKLSTIKMYNATTLISGDIDGIIRCWDIRVDLQKNNKSQRQYQYVSDIKHKLCQHEDGINCFESIPSKHRLIAGSGDGQISVWDLRKSSDLNAIRIQMERKKKKALAKKRRQHQSQKEKENELLRMFGDREEAEEIKPKTLIDISDKMGDEILSLCLMKYGRKLCSGMTSGFLNIFHYNQWDWYKDRVLGHSTNLSCIVKYDEDCCITGCGDGVVRLISIYPHKFIHAIGTHNLNAIDCIAMSADKGYVVSFACGDRRGMAQNRTNRLSLRNNHQFSVENAEIVKVWNMNWHPVIFYNEKMKKMRDKFNRRRHSNQCQLAKGIKEFLELSDEDFSFTRFNEEDLERFKDGKRSAKKKGKKEKDDYVFSDDDDNDEKDEDIDIDVDLDEFEVDGGEATQERRIRYKQFEDREYWMKSLRKRKKIRAIGKHDVNQHHNRRFFKDLC